MYTSKKYCSFLKIISFTSRKWIKTILSHFTYSVYDEKTETWKWIKQLPAGNGQVNNYINSVLIEHHISFLASSILHAAQTMTVSVNSNTILVFNCIMFRLSSRVSYLLRLFLDRDMGSISIVYVKKSRVPWPHILRRNLYIELQALLYV